MKLKFHHHFETTKNNQFRKCQNQNSRAQKFPKQLEICYERENTAGGGWLPRLGVLIQTTVSSCYRYTRKLIHVGMQWMGKMNWLLTSRDLKQTSQIVPLNHPNKLSLYCIYLRLQFLFPVSLSCFPAWKFAPIWTELLQIK